MNTGFIKLHRSLLDWEWYDDLATTKLFIHLLLTANFKNKSWKGIDVPAGSVVTGRKKLAKETGLTERQIRTAIKRLKSTNEVSIQTSAICSVISIQNWDLYQDERPTKRPASDQQVTSKRPQLKNVKNGKNGNNKKNTKKEPRPLAAESDAQEIYAQYPLKIGKANAIKAIKKALSKIEKEKLIEIVKNYRKARMMANGKAAPYTPHPATWFNGERWLDDQDTWKIDQNLKGQINGTTQNSSQYV